MTRCWEVTREGSALVTRYCNSPMNYFTDAALTELASLVSEWATSDARAIILTGDGSGRFITHFSAEEIRRGVDDQLAAARLGPIRNHAVNRTLNAITALETPVIAALNGDTMGFGYELALACDLRIGERGDYRYGLPETRLGIIPGSGGTQRLVRLIGLDRALSLVMCGRIFAPEEALEMGLVTELRDDALRGALELVEDIASNPRLAVTSAKRALHLGFDTDLSGSGHRKRCEPPDQAGT